MPYLNPRDWLSRRRHRHQTENRNSSFIDGGIVHERQDLSEMFRSSLTSDILESLRNDLYGESYSIGFRDDIILPNEVIEEVPTDYCQICGSKKLKIETKYLPNSYWKSCKPCSDFYDYCLDQFVFRKSYKLLQNMYNYICEYSKPIRKVLKRVVLDDSEVLTNKYSDKYKRRYCRFCGRRLRGVYIELRNNSNHRMCRDCEPIFDTFLKQLEYKFGYNRISRTMNRIKNDPIAMAYLSKFKVDDEQW